MNASPALFRLKVCCIADECEAALAIAHGASALGLVARMPSGPGTIDDSAIARIARVVPPGVATFLLTPKRRIDDLLAQHAVAATTTVQFVDAVGLDVYAAFRRERPGIGLVQVIHVEGPASLDEALRVAPHVDALLLDSGRPGAAIPELGGTGRVHDWSVSRAIVERCGKPVWLAGGLRPDNVAEAVAAVGPFGVDVCSGLRTDGRLDEAKLAALAHALRGR